MSDLDVRQALVVLNRHGLLKRALHDFLDKANAATLDSVEHIAAHHSRYRGLRWTYLSGRSFSIREMSDAQILCRLGELRILKVGGYQSSRVEQIQAQTRIKCSFWLKVFSLEAEYRGLEVSDG